MEDKDIRLALALAILEEVWVKGKISNKEWLEARNLLIKKYKELKEQEDAENK